MKKKKSKMIAKKGEPPGTLIYTGDKREDFRIDVIDYTSDKYEEFEVKEIEECFPLKDTPTITWINITGLHKVDVIEKIVIVYLSEV